MTFDRIIRWMTIRLTDGTEQKLPLKTRKLGTSHELRLSPYVDVPEMRAPIIAEIKAKGLWPIDSAEQFQAYGLKLDTEPTHAAV